MVVLHTNEVENVALKNTIKVVGVDFVKAVQSMLHGITRVTFHANEAKLRALSQPFKIKEKVIEVQLIEDPFGESKVLCVQNVVPNKVIAEYLGIR